MRDLILVLWLALAGADRIDLLAGQGPVWGTPFLALTPLLLAVEALHLVRRRGRFRLPPGTGEYGIGLAVLLGIGLASVFFSYDAADSARRLGLLGAQAAAALLVAARLATRPDPGRLLVRAATLAIVLGTLSNASQVAWFMSRGVAELDRTRLLDLAPVSYGTIYPRLSGLSVDANRGPFQLLLFTLLLAGFAPGTRRTRVLLVLGGLAVLLSVSRSAWLAAGAGAIVAFASSRRLRLSPGWLVGGAAGAVLAAVLLLALPRAAEAVLGLGEVVARRFTGGDASGHLHLALIGRAVELATGSAKVALVGTGYGTAEHFVQDLFPGASHGNFHSLYFSFLAETGIPGLLAVVALIAGAALRSRRWLPLIAATAAFNVFYQTQTEPLFWFVLAAAWLRLGEARGGTVPPHDLRTSSPHRLLQPQTRP